MLYERYRWRTYDCHAASNSAVETPEDALQIGVGLDQAQKRRRGPIATR